MPFLCSTKIHEKLFERKTSHITGPEGRRDCQPDCRLEPMSPCLAARMVSGRLESHGTTAGVPSSMGVTFKNLPCFSKKPLAPRGFMHKAMYKKAGVYFRTACSPAEVGSGRIDNGLRLIQEKHPDDFQNLQKGFFEPPGTQSQHAVVCEMLCPSTGKFFGFPVEGNSRPSALFQGCVVLRQENCTRVPRSPKLIV